MSQLVRFPKPLFWLGRWIPRHARGTVGIWILLIAGGLAVGGPLAGQLTAGGYLSTGSDSERVVTILEENPKLGTISLLVVLTTKHRRPAKRWSPSAALAWGTKLQRPITKTLERYRQISFWEGPFALGLVDPPVNRHINTGEIISVWPVRLAARSSSSQTSIRALHAALGNASTPSARISLLGGSTLVEHFSDQVRRDVTNAERWALPIIAIVLLVAFLSLPAAMLPIALALGALSVILGVLRVITEVVELSDVSLTVASVLALGLCIDFALFTVMRFREQLAMTPSPNHALMQTLTTTGRTIILSSFCIAISFLSLYVGGVDEFHSIAISGVIAVAVTMLTALTLLPALIYISFPRLDRLSIRHATVTGRENRFWRWLGRQVNAHPFVLTIGAVALLLILATPLMSLRLESTSFGLPGSNDAFIKESRRIAELVGVVNLTPLEVVTRDAGTVHATLERDANFESIRTLGTQKPWALVTALVKSGLDTPSTAHSIRALRARLKESSTESFVGGLPAARMDLAEAVESHTPAIVLTAVFLVFCALAAGLKSLLIPLKAVLGSLLSVAAALGLLVVTFPTHPHQSDLNFLVPIIVFVVVFGLSIDYELFLLSRIREAVLAGYSTGAGVTIALARCARSLTLAGLCMAIVFAALLTSSLDVLKQLGFGIAVAVLVDITIVRCMLMPAAAVLIGKWNWWFPSIPGRRIKKVHDRL